VDFAGLGRDPENCTATLNDHRHRWESENLAADKQRMTLIRELSSQAADHEGNPSKVDI
jgi:hypothetical protein